MKNLKKILPVFVFWTSLLNANYDVLIDRIRSNNIEAVKNMLNEGQPAILTPEERDFDLFEPIFISIIENNNQGKNMLSMTKLLLEHAPEGFVYKKASDNHKNYLELVLIHDPRVSYLEDVYSLEMAKLIYKNMFFPELDNVDLQSREDFLNYISKP
jgi:hypothetical protein